MATFNTNTSGSEIETLNSLTRTRRRVVTWDPGSDTLIALGTLLAFWGCYWAGTTVSEWFLLVGVVVVGTLVPAVTVLRQ